MRLEVRCCCQPTKLLGYLPLPPGVEPAAGKTVRFCWNVRNAGEWVAFGLVTPTVLHEIRLPIERIENGTGYAWLAFKSEETSIETLRQIPGFLEARP